MKRIKHKILGSMLVACCISSSANVQAGTVLKPTVIFHQTQTSQDNIDVKFGLRNLGSNITALEVSIIGDDIQKVSNINSKVSNSYSTYTLKTLSTGQEELTFYIVSNDKETVLDLNEDALHISLQATNRITIDKDKVCVKLIEQGYNTVEHTKVDIDVNVGVDEDTTKPDVPSDEEEELPAPPVDSDTPEVEGPPAIEPEKPTVPENSPSTGGNSGSTDGGASSGGSSNSGSSSSSESKEDETDKEPTTDKEPISEEEVIDVSFKDLNNHWAGESILKMARKGIIKGYEDGTFKPNASITRGEFATLLVRAFGLEFVSDNAPFSDVKQDKWYTASINALYAAGITSGLPDGTFGVNKAITNEEICTLLYRIISTLNINMEMNSNVNQEFTDEDSINNYAKEAVLALQKSGIINGQPDGSFGPKKTTTRAQVAVMLDRILKTVE